jgi:hypothetical protein
LMNLLKLVLKFEHQFKMSSGFWGRFVTKNKPKRFLRTVANRAGPR